MKPLAASAGTLASIATAIEVAPGATRVQLFPGYGTWKGRNGLGPYTITDRAHADAIIAATASARGVIKLDDGSGEQLQTRPGAIVVDRRERIFGRDDMAGF